ncbi:hypothetical protein R1flu_009469 [Riccia fluitans]|uniref:Proteasome assembly chaperone 3 n=1 Tax=Riccia fluitans TaxID=41844 RepID=A0ABD1Z6B9_9MARC
MIVDLPRPNSQEDVLVLLNALEAQDENVSDFRGTKNSLIRIMDSFPVKSKRATADIQGVQTELVLSGYDDSILVLVTQIGKMGTLLHAKKEEIYGGTPTFSVNILMGKRDEPLLQACARQVIEDISNSGGSRPLILSLGLKDHSPETLKSVVQLIVANKIW